MENIIFIYDRDHSRKSGQFTVLLKPAELIRGRWVVSKRSAIYSIKDMQAITARVPDKDLLRTAVESELALRKIEGRFLSPEQEFTRLRIASCHLDKFITFAQRLRILLYPDGSAAAFRIDRKVLPEIWTRGDRLEVRLGGIALSRAQIVVTARPVTLISDQRIVQVRDDIPFSFLTQIPADRPLAEAQLNRLLEDLSRQPDRVRIRSTGEQEIQTIRNCMPRAVLNLDESAGKARLYFKYEGRMIKDNDDAAVIIDIGRHIEIHRNRRAEEDCKAVLLSQGCAVRPERDLNWRPPRRPLEALVPALEKSGFEVHIGERRITGPLSVEWQINTEKQHIRVQAKVVTGELTIGLGVLGKALQDRKPYVERADGSLGIISGEIRRILTGLFERGTLDQDSIVFNRADFTRVRDCLPSADNVRTDSSYEALCRYGGRLEGVKRYPIPKGLESVLRSYQMLGFNWMHTLRELGLNGILADDMGLGKTVQVLALIRGLKEQGALGRPVLLIVPKTLIFNWELEIGKFAPDLAVYAFTGAGRIRQARRLETFDMVLTSYGLVRTETPLLCAVTWEYLILDEAQAIKNSETMTFRAIRQIPSISRLSITGTPVENSAADLWSQFDFLMPGFLGDPASFRQNYTDSVQDRQRLRDRTGPYILRRTKSQVLAELPAKTEVTIYCNFSEDQKHIYDQALVAARDELAALDGSRSFRILGLILRLRQIACHPRLAVRDSRTGAGSGKTEQVLQTAMPILAAGHKMLIFSQFTRHLHLVQELFWDHQVPVFYLDGQTKDRAAVVASFQSHAGACVFLISLKAGGTGLNLSQASYVFLLDPWWNPAVENQAIDRCHRIGQSQPVTVYRFITRGSIEEKVAALKAVKNEIVSAVIDESAPRYLPLDEKKLKSLITDGIGSHKLY